MQGISYQYQLFVPTENQMYITVCIMHAIIVILIYFIQVELITVLLLVVLLVV